MRDLNKLVCQVVPAGRKEEAGGSYCPAGGGAGGGTGQHGAAQRPFQKDQPAGKLAKHEITAINIILIIVINLVSQQ